MFLHGHQEILSHKIWSSKEKMRQKVRSRKHVDILSFIRKKIREKKRKKRGKRMGYSTTPSFTKKKTNKTFCDELEVDETQTRALMNPVHRRHQVSSSDSASGHPYFSLHPVHKGERLRFFYGFLWFPLLFISTSCQSQKSDASVSGDRDDEIISLCMSMSMSTWFSCCDTRSPGHRLNPDTHRMPRLHKNNGNVHVDQPVDCTFLMVLYIDQRFRVLFRVSHIPYILSSFVFPSPL